MEAEKKVEQGKEVAQMSAKANTGGKSQLNKTETAAYIADIVLQLRNIAKQADLKFLVYFLEMAFQEAFSQSTQEKTGKNPLK